MGALSTKSNKGHTNIKVDHATLVFRITQSHNVSIVLDQVSHTRHATFSLHQADLSGNLDKRRQHTIKEVANELSVIHQQHVTWLHNDIIHSTFFVISIVRVISTFRSYVYGFCMFR